MRAFLMLWRREVAAYFLSPIAYITTIFFLVIMGFSFWLLANVMASGPAGAAVMRELFCSFFFWLCLLIVVPVLTMRLLAEERRVGTLETLMTAPVSEAAVVLGKFAGALTFFAVMWIPTAAYVWILRTFSAASAPVDFGAVAAGYLGTLLVGMFYLAVGLFCSALTRNQIVAAIMAFALIGIAFLAGFLPYLSRSAWSHVGLYLSSVSHMLDFARGAVDTRPVVLYLSSTAFFLFATARVLAARKGA